VWLIHRTYKQWNADRSGVRGASAAVPKVIKQALRFMGLLSSNYS